MKGIIKRNLIPILGFICGLTIAMTLTLFAHENPWHVFVILIRESFGSRYALGMTMFYSTPLIFTGLSVAIAFQAGLFNIGAEGQLNLGALAAALVGVFAPAIPYPIAPIVAILAAALAGGIWGWIPGWLRAKRGSHEVITTIMLNFVAAGIASWVTLYVAPNPNSQNPETAPIAKSYLLPNPFRHWFPHTPVSLAFPFAIVCAVVLSILLKRTALGYKIRAVGENEHAAHEAGISVARVRIFTMALSGALASMVAVGEVLGNAGRFRLGFSPDYGFIGIAVALLANCSPIGVILTGILFGALHNGCSNLDMDTDTITRDFSLLLQGLIILCVSVRVLPQWIRLKRRKATES